MVVISCYTPCGEDDSSYRLPREYIDCLTAAGLETIIVPAGSGAALDRADGLVLAGGGDIDPRTYGGKPHPTNYMVDHERDTLELRLLDRALAAGMPVLAICRGMQILNVAFGGDLVAHVPERYGEAVRHRLPPREPVAHQVRVACGSRLAAALGATEVCVMSWHHQAVDAVGEGLSVSAHAEDGVVEALETEDGGWVLGVQWHPELDAREKPPQRRLFDDFAAAVT
ncbi:MAG: gamma-glutamyl-gamma-aminobutyrate hydrolase family protein, partial [Deltaproteobacteria bacterium]